MQKFFVFAVVATMLLTACGGSEAPAQGASGLDGVYTLQTLFLESRNLCLEGNDPDSESVAGAAFMADCSSPASGQMWKLTSAGDGYYTLQTLFLEERNLCLEGAGGPDGSPAFMADCSNPATGQLWKLVPAEDGYYTLWNVNLEPQNMCLEGNDPDSEFMSGAAFMNDCSSPASGQLWKLVPVQ